MVTILHIFSIFSLIQILTLFIPPLNIYGDFVLKYFSKGTVFEIRQWGFAETGLFGYTELIYVMFALTISLIYVYRSKVNGIGIKSEIKYLFATTLGIFFALINDLMVIWLENYNMYFLIAFSLLVFIFSLNHFVVYKYKNIRETLQETEENFQTITEEISDGVEILIGQRHYWVNDAFAEIFGYEREELLGKRFEMLMHTENDAELIKKVRESLEKERKETFVTKSKTKSGKEITVEFIPKNIKFEGKDALMVVVRDITERIKANELVKQEVEKLKELDKMRKDLISRVSHELKTPITQITGASEFLRDFFSDKMESSAIDLIKMIQRGGNRLEKLVNRLLDVSRIEYNKLELDLEKVNLGNLIENVVRNMSHLVQDQDLSLKMSLINSLSLKIDKLRMSQVITNLISNAIKNTPPQGEIRVKMRQSSENIFIEIRDTGVGLTDQEKEILFTRFGKITRSKKGLEYLNIKGSGLGLYISKQIVRLHGGKIWAESEGRNKGSIFVIKLPLTLKI